MNEVIILRRHLPLPCISEPINDEDAQTYEESLAMTGRLAGREAEDELASLRNQERPENLIKEHNELYTAPFLLLMGGKSPLFGTVHRVLTKEPLVIEADKAVWLTGETTHHGKTIPLTLNAIKREERTLRFSMRTGSEPDDHEPRNKVLYMKTLNEFSLEGGELYTGKPAVLWGMASHRGLDAHFPLMAAMTERSHIYGIGLDEDTTSPTIRLPYSDYESDPPF